ncbi:UNVERIFIED_CONTAM: hypothetical protein Sradi_3144000 [Sesamum radiatum]|uniref:Uncharacterized protein n=1 Tax=Sesamum radiatum TaxID=300843 RepID=A0AAW2REP6_SESRA
MLKKASPGLFYFTSRGDAHFLSSDISIEEWKRHYFFISSPTPWPLPRSWISAAPDVTRYSTHTHPALFQQLLEQLNSFHYDPCSLAQPALLFRYGLSPKEVALDTAAVTMFNKLLQDKTLGIGKGPGDSRGKKQVDPLSPRAKRVKASSGSFAQPTKKPMTHSHLLRPSPLQVKKEKLGLGEESSLLKEEGDDGQALDFIKGLLSSSDRRFLEDLTPSHAANLLASSASKTILLIGDLLEQGGRATEGALKRVEDLEDDIRQFVDAGYPPLTTPTNSLDINAGLADAPKPDEDVPPELPESLLRALPEGDAPEDLVEEVVPLKWFSLLLGVLRKVHTSRVALSKTGASKAALSKTGAIMVALSKTRASKAALSKTGASKAALSKTGASKATLSKTGASKAVLSTTQANKAALSKIRTSKAVLSKACASRATLASIAPVRHL